ncbi:MAG: glycoside hydrolase family 31 protein [Acidobacteria bacterium]|nr:glycoside hydrolase family 31 protein [Acidobacteriota bacterium]
MTSISRRELLKRVGSVSAGALVGAPGAGARDDAITVAAQPVEIAIAAASSLTARITIAAIVNGSAQAVRGDGSLVDRRWPAPVARLRTLPRPAAARAGDLIVRASVGGPERPALHITVSHANGRTVQQLHIDQQTGALTFALGDRPLLGLGEGGPQFDRRGSTDRMRSGQSGYELRTHGGRVPVQWLIGTDGWAMFIHQPYGTFDFSGTEGRFDPPAGAPLPLDFFVVGASDPAAIMAEYARLTGYPEMPPLWSFGYQQSHRTLASRDEILQEAKMFREKKLPCDTMIYLGTGFCPSGWNTDNGEFVFNKNVFPDPPAMIQQLHDDHFKVVLHIVLEGRTLTGAVGDPCTAPPLPSGRTSDGKWPDDRQVSCYWPVHKPLFDAGVDGWWPDQGDGLDGPSRLARNRMYWDGSQQWRPNQRVYALHRNGRPGMQRFGAFLWSGDVYSTWETLKTHVPVAVNTALSGIPFWGTDIGGFVPTKEFTGELYVRWFQFGAFCPLFRSHGRTWTLRLPWGWNTGSIEPDEISNYTGGAANPDLSELRNAAVEPICKKFLELRYRLMPYLYSAVHEAHQTGLPVVRALWLHYPIDRAAVARGDQYLWGRDILVAPVVEKGATSRSVYLPAGRWYDFWTEEARDGGREISRPVDLETMPLFVRAGAILPLGPVKQYTSEPVDAPLTVQVFPGANGAFTLYEDDGRTFDYRRGDWMGIEFRWNDTTRRLTLQLANGSRMRPPASRRITVRAAGMPITRDVVFTGTAIEVRLRPDEMY